MKVGETIPRFSMFQLPDLIPEFDPFELAKTYVEIAQKSAHIFSELIKRHGVNGTPVFEDNLGITKAFSEMIGQLFADPARLAGMQFRIWNDYVALCQGSTLHWLGYETKPVIEPGGMTVASNLKFGNKTSFSITSSNRI